MSTVAIPIETKVRELDGKIWLSINLLTQGFDVVLGPSSEIKDNIHLISPDIFITKDPYDKNLDFIKKLNKSNCTVCGLDTEGGVFYSIEQYLNNKDEVLDYLDIYFAWGQKQAKALRKHTKSSCKIVPTGNPRFDLLFPPFRSLYYNKGNEIRNDIGDYILVNTNFPRANHYNESRFRSTIRDTYGYIDNGEWVHMKRLYHEFILAVYELSSYFDDMKIVVRPHPSENNGSYIKEFRDSNNVIVKSEGDVRNWIGGASMTIHNSCTTGIEAAMMGCPVISYQPVIDETYDKEIANSISIEIHNKSDLIGEINEQIKTRDQYDLSNESIQYLSSYFNNFDSFAGENISKEIKNIDSGQPIIKHHLRPNIMGRFERAIKSSPVSYQALKLYDSVNRLLGNPEPAERRAYFRKKFPGLSESEIRDKCTDLVDSDLGRNVTITQLSGAKYTYNLGILHRERFIDSIKGI